MDRLAEFKKNYYEKSGDISRLFHQNLGISEKEAYEIFLSVHYHAVGIHSICLKNPLVEQALKKAQLPTPEIDFRENLKKFILIQLKYYCCRRARFAGPTASTSPWRPRIPAAPGPEQY